MVSKTRYFTLVCIFLVIAVMFQFIGNSIGLFYSFEDNAYEDYTPSPRSDTAQSPGRLACFDNPDGYVAIVSPDNTDDYCPIQGVVDACTYLKLQYRCFTSLGQLDLTDMSAYALLVVSVDDINVNKDMAIFNTFTTYGVNIIFATLPDCNTIAQSRSLNKLFGVKRLISESVKIDGITLFEGFLLGGKAILEKAKSPKIPYFTLNSSSKAYVMAIMDDQKATDVKNEDLPHIVWRTTCDNSFVFVVNGNYLMKSTGIGFFVAMLSEMTEFFAYPVINAQTMLLENFPTLSKENGEGLRDIYSQTIDHFFQTSVWPSINSVLDQTKFKATSFLTSSIMPSQAEVSDDEKYKKLLDFYLKQIAMKRGEMGISAYDYEKSGRLKSDLALFSRIADDYDFTVLATGGADESSYAPLLAPGGELESVTTLVRPLEPDGDISRFEYYNDKVLSIPATINGYYHTDNDEILMRSVQTALAASNISVNAKQLVYPQNEKKDNWVKLSTDLARFSQTFWRPYRRFSRLTVSEADKRVRSYLATEYECRNDGNTVHISASGYDENAYFILRTRSCHVVSAENAEYIKIENGVYLLTLTAPTATVKLEKNMSVEINTMFAK